MKLNNFMLVLRMQTRQAFFHKKAALATILSWGLRVFLTLLLYHGVYKLLGKDNVKGITFDVAASSMLLYTVYAGFASREVYRVINNEYKSGAIEIWFNKPVAYLGMKIAEVMGKAVPSALALMACTCLYWAIYGLPEADRMLLRFISGFFLLFFGVVISYILYCIVGLTVIWLEDASPVFAITDKMIMVFGGIYIPIGFFSPGFRLFGEALPIGATNFVSQMFYPDFFTNLPRFVITQCVWIFLLTLALRQMNKSAYTRLTVNGG